MSDYKCTPEEYYNNVLKEKDFSKIYFRVPQHTLNKWTAKGILDNIAAFHFSDDGISKSLKLQEYPYSPVLILSTNDRAAPSDGINFLIWYNHQKDINFTSEYWPQLVGISVLVDGEYPYFWPTTNTYTPV